MATQVSSRLLALFKNISRTAGISCIVLGCLVLAGWQFDIPVLKSVLPGLATMKANTAIAFMLVGASLWLRGHERSNRKIFIAAQACAGLAALLSLLTLGEYISGLNFGLDQLLYRDLQTAEASFPGRMSLTTAFNFALLSVALLVLDAEIRRNIRPAQFLVLIAGAVAAIALLGYLYGVDSLYSLGLYSSMALHTALGTALLSLGILCARPQKGFMEIAVTETAGGMVLRRLMPLTILILVVLGWVRLRGQQAGFYDTNFGLALMVLLSAASLSVILWLNAGRLNRVDAERRQTDEALKANERRFRALVENSGMLINLINREGVLTYVSPSSAQVVGYTPKEMIGRRAVEFLHPDEVADKERPFSQMFRSPGTVLKVERRVRHKDGTWRWVEGYSTNLLEDPAVGALVFNYRDITDRKWGEEEIRKLNKELDQRVSERTAALSQANALLQVLLDHMPDHIYFKDAQSRFIRNSRSQARALGLSDPAEAVGKSDFDFFPHARVSYEMEQEIMQSGRPLVNQEERVVWPDGRETWVSTTKMPLLDQTGQIIGTFGISRDITERKRAEAAVQKAKLELEAANKELEAFSYSVSHDLRSPLRSIDGFSQALLEDYAAQLPAEGQHQLKRVRAASQRMGQLIDDLLNLSRVTRASMRSVSVDLGELAQDILAELQRTQPERSVNFKISPDLKAHGDPNLLRVVLENLLNNAWKFTSKLERAEIEFGSNDENDETIYFIRDNGAGFDMAYGGKLFGAFQRLHSMTEFSGTGIGLATVQRIINRHGGRIWAEGAVDRGATFLFTLPALERAKPKSQPQEIESLAERVKEII